MQDFEMTPPLQPEAAVSARSRLHRRRGRRRRGTAGASAGAGASREGLPPAYRMRHAPHYVEQLMGDTPLQTVRQISIEEIDAVTAATSTGLTSPNLPRPSAKLVFCSPCW